MLNLILFLFLAEDVQEDFKKFPSDKAFWFFFFFFYFAYYFNFIAL